MDDGSSGIDSATGPEPPRPTPSRGSSASGCRWPLFSFEEPRTTGLEAFVWGDGEHGELSVTVPDGVQHCPLSVEFFRGKSLKCVGAGSFFTVFVDVDGRVETSGIGAQGQLGHGDRQSSYVPLPVRDLLTERVVAVACGSAHTLALCSDGRVYSWGNGNFGRLGHGDEEERCSPTRIDFFSGTRLTAVGVSCGDLHSVAWTADGLLYSWGYGENGQLGHGDTENSLVPAFVEALRRERVACASLGWRHTIAVTDPGIVYTWGSGISGQLGHGNELDQHAPKIVRELQHRRVRCIAAGGTFSLALSESGDVWSWGDGNSGQLGNGTENDCFIPQRVPLLHRRGVRRLACGFDYAACITDAGEVFTWGRGHLGQLGYPSESFQVEPVTIPELRHRHAMKVACGAAHMIALTDDMTGPEGPRLLAALQILHMERSYVMGLAIIVEEYMHPLLYEDASDRIISRRNVERMFRYVEEIYECHRSSLAVLERQLSLWPMQCEWGKMLHEMLPRVRLYKDYVRAYPTAYHLFLQSCQEKSKFATFLRQQVTRLQGSSFLLPTNDSASFTDSNSPMDLRSLLTLPLQYFPQLQMSVEALRACTPDDHNDADDLDSATDKVVETTAHIEEIRLQAEASARKLRESMSNTVLEHFVGLEAYARPERRYIREGTVVEFHRKNPGSSLSLAAALAPDRWQKVNRLWVLFNDILVCVTDKRIIYELPLGLTWVVDLVDTYEFENAFELISPEWRSIVLCPSADEKQNWLHDLSLTINHATVTTTDPESTSHEEKHLEEALRQRSRSGSGGSESGSPVSTLRDTRRRYGTFRYQDGGTYTGWWIDAEHDGKGTFLYPSGLRYEGDWVGSVKEGVGILENEATKEHYEGELKGNKADGFGTFRYANSDVYIGEWKQAVRHGRGKMIYEAGDIYEGEWKDEKRSGQGIFKTVDGSVYEGSWENGVRNGQGTMKNHNGDHYTGNWKDDKRNGHGVSTTATGVHYQGEWANDKKHGKGMMVWPNGDKYKGEFAQDMRHGEGVFVWEDGTRFRGQWAENKRIGNGALYFPNGDVLMGEFQEGLEGHGILVSSGLYRRKAEKASNTVMSKWTSQIKYDEAKKSVRKADQEWLSTVDKEDLDPLKSNLVAVLANDEHPLQAFLSRFVDTFNVVHHVPPTDHKNLQNIHHSAVEDVRSFLEWMMQTIQSTFEELNEEWAELTIQLALKEVVFPMIFAPLFAMYSAVNNERDMQFAEKVRQLSAISPQELGIHKSLWISKNASGTNVHMADFEKSMASGVQFVVERYTQTPSIPYDKAMRIMTVGKELPRFHSLHEKWQCLSGVFDAITEYAREYCHNTSFMSADDLIPILSFVIVKVNPHQLYSLWNLMDDFMDPSMSFGELGNHITHLQICMSYILSFDLGTLSQRRPGVSSFRASRRLL